MELNKENLMREIEARKGLIISEAALKTDCLLSSYYQLISDYNLSPTMKSEIASFFEEEPTNWNYFYNKCHLIPEKEEEANIYLNEDIYDFFNEIAPEGYYFGNTEGDGACFGFFETKDESEF